MRKRILLIGAASAAALALAVPVVNAQRPGAAGRPGSAGIAQGGGRMGPGPMQPGQMGGRGWMRRGGPAGAQAPVQRLELTEDQRGKFEDIIRKTRDRAAPLADELELARHSLHREAFAEKRDDRKVADLAAKVSALEKQLLDVHLTSKIAMAGILTAEQREIMRTHPEPRGIGRGRGR